MSVNTEFHPNGLMYEMRSEYLSRLLSKAFVTENIFMKLRIAERQFVVVFCTEFCQNLSTNIVYVIMTITEPIFTKLTLPW